MRSFSDDAQIQINKKTATQPKVDVNLNGTKVLCDDGIYASTTWSTTYPTNIITDELEVHETLEIAITEAANPTANAKNLTAKAIFVLE